MEKDNPIIAALDVGRKAFRAGDYSAALTACLEVLEYVPNHPLAHLMAGFAQQAAGNPGKAIRHFRFAVAHDPTDMEARDALAMCLLERGRHAEALPHLRQVVAADPNNANARYNLGRCLIDLRNFVEAERVYQDHIEKNPGDAEAFNHLGLARLAKGSTVEAETCFRTAIQLNEHDPIFHANLAQTLHQLGKPDEAGQSYEQAVSLAPDSPGFRVQHGWFLLGEGALSRAEDRFREALQRDPEDVSASAGLAAALEQREEYRVGLQVLRPFISAVHPHPQIAISYASLSRRQQTPGQALPVVRRAIRPGVDRRQEARLRFSEGDLLDAIGDVDAAFDAYQRANEAEGTKYNAEAHENFVDAVIETFTPSLFASVPKPDVDTGSSLIICGMPRSGSVLLDKILSTHPDVHGAGELDDLPTIAFGLRHYVSSGALYPENVRGVNQELINQLAKARMDSLKRTSECTMVADRLPHNFMHLGLAALITPGAKVIHTVRDPVDTCLSCYFQYFGGSSFAFSNRLDALSSFFRQYHRLMTHWERVLPIDVHTVRYEDLVAGDSGVVAGVIDFLQLDSGHDDWKAQLQSRMSAAQSFAGLQPTVDGDGVGYADRYRHRIGALVTLAQLQQ